MNPLAGPERDAEILRAVIDGKHDPIEWRPLLLDDGSTLDVMADALKLDGVRVNVTQVTAELIGDALGGRLPTTKLSDMIWQMADVRIRPQTSTPNAAMSTTARMVAHSEACDREIAGRAGLIAGVGKDWVVTNRLVATPSQEANYGWHDASGKPLQPLGLAHNVAHTDYSQVVRLVRPYCHLAHELVSSEGQLPITRHPWSEPDQAIRAAHYTPANRTGVDWIVIHSTESAEAFSAARAVGRFFALASTQASAHWVVDAFSTLRCVPEGDVAWHAPGANRTGIGIELVGHAASDWSSDYAELTIRRAANVLRYSVARWAIPLRFVDATGLLAGERGVTTHHEATLAWHKSTHWDPGPKFPMEKLLAFAVG